MNYSWSLTGSFIIAKFIHNSKLAIDKKLLAPPPHPYPRTATISPLGIYLWHTSTSYFSNVGRLLILQQARFVWQGRPLGDVWQLKEEWHRRLNVPKWQSRLNVDPDQNTSRALGWMKWHLVLHFQQFVDFLSLLRIVGFFFVFSMKALKKVEKCNELIDIHWPIKGPERHFALMVSPYMYNIYTMRIINNLLTRKAKRKMKRRKKPNAYSYFYKCPRESSYFWNIDGEVFHTEVPRPEWAVARDLVAPQHTRAAPSPLKSG